MADAKMTSLSSAREDRRQDDDSTSQLSEMSEMWDTSGMSMSALCLNMLQDFTDAASYCSEVRGVSTDSMKKESSKKGFADFFKIKRKKKSKKQFILSSSSDSIHVSENKMTENEVRNRDHPPIFLEKESEDTKRKKSWKKKQQKMPLTDDNFDVSLDKNATLPLKKKNKSSLDQIGKQNTLPLPENHNPDMKKKKFFKEKRSSLPRTDTDEKTIRLPAPLKLLETSIQKMITNVNQKFPGSDNFLKNEGNRRKSTESKAGAIQSESQLAHWSNKDLENNDNPFFKESLNESTIQGMSQEVNNQTSARTRRADIEVVVADEKKEDGIVLRQLTPSPRARSRQKQDQRGRRGRSAEVPSSPGTETHANKRVRRRALSREWVIVKTTTREDTTIINPVHSKSKLPTTATQSAGEIGIKNDISSMEAAETRNDATYSLDEMENIRKPEEAEKDHPIMNSGIQADEAQEGLVDSNQIYKDTVCSAIQIPLEAQIYCTKGSHQEQEVNGEHRVAIESPQSVLDKVDSLLQSQETMELNENLTECTSLHIPNRLNTTALLAEFEQEPESIRMSVIQSLLKNQLMDESRIQQFIDCTNSDEASSSGKRRWTKRKPAARGKRQSPVLSKKQSPMLGKRQSPMLGKRQSPILGKRQSPSLGKRQSPMFYRGNVEVDMLLDDSASSINEPLVISDSICIADNSMVPRSSKICSSPKVRPASHVAKPRWTKRKSAIREIRHLPLFGSSHSTHGFSPDKMDSESDNLSDSSSGNYIIPTAGRHLSREENATGKPRWTQRKSVTREKRAMVGVIGVDPVCVTSNTIEKRSPVGEANMRNGPTGPDDATCIDDKSALVEKVLGIDLNTEKDFQNKHEQPFGRIRNIETKQQPSIGVQDGDMMSPVDIQTSHKPRYPKLMSGRNEPSFESDKSKTKLFAVAQARDAVSLISVKSDCSKSPTSEDTQMKLESSASEIEHNRNDLLIHSHNQVPEEQPFSDITCEREKESCFADMSVSNGPPVSEPALDTCLSPLFVTIDEHTQEDNIENLNASLLSFLYIEKLKANILDSAENQEPCSKIALHGEKVTMEHMASQDHVLQLEKVSQHLPVKNSLGVYEKDQNMMHWQNKVSAGSEQYADALNVEHEQEQVGLCKQKDVRENEFCENADIVLLRKLSENEAKCNTYSLAACSLQELKYDPNKISNTADISPEDARNQESLMHNIKEYVQSETRSIFDSIAPTESESEATEDGHGYTTKVRQQLNQETSNRAREDESLLVLPSFKLDSTNLMFSKEADFLGERQFHDMASRRFSPGYDNYNLLSSPRRLNIDVPYSDSGFSETETETMSPCSFGSAVSQADTVTDPFTDDDNKFSFPVMDSVTLISDSGFNWSFPGLNLNSSHLNNESIKLDKKRPSLNLDTQGNNSELARQVLPNADQYMETNILLESVRNHDLKERSLASKYDPFIPEFLSKSELESLQSDTVRNLDQVSQDFECGLSEPWNEGCTAKNSTDANAVESLLDHSKGNAKESKIRYMPQEQPYNLENSAIKDLKGLQQTSSPTRSERNFLEEVSSSDIAIGLKETYLPEISQDNLGQELVAVAWINPENKSISPEGKVYIRTQYGQESSSKIRKAQTWPEREYVSAEAKADKIQSDHILPEERVAKTVVEGQGINFDDRAARLQLECHYTIEEKIRHKGRVSSPVETIARIQLEDYITPDEREAKITLETKDVSPEKDECIQLEEQCISTQEGEDAKTKLVWKEMKFEEKVAKELIKNILVNSKHLISKEQYETSTVSDSEIVSLEGNAFSHVERVARIQLEENHDSPDEKEAKMLLERKGVSLGKEDSKIHLDEQQVSPQKEEAVKTKIDWMDVKAEERIAKKIDIIAEERIAKELIKDVLITSKQLISKQKHKTFKIAEAETISLEGKTSPIEIVAMIQLEDHDISPNEKKVKIKPESVSFEEAQKRFEGKHSSLDERAAKIQHEYHHTSHDEKETKTRFERKGVSYGKEESKFQLGEQHVSSQEEEAAKTKIEYKSAPFEPHMTAAKKVANKLIKEVFITNKEINKGYKKPTVQKSHEEYPLAFFSVTENNPSIKCQIIPNDHKSVPKKTINSNSQVPVSLMKELEVEQFTWSEYAEIVSFYKHLPTKSVLGRVSFVIDECDKSLLPPTWIWNGSRYTTTYESTISDSEAIQFPDPLPCQSIGISGEKEAFVLISNRKTQISPKSASQIKQQNEICSDCSDAANSNCTTQNETVVETGVAGISTPSQCQYSKDAQIADVPENQIRQRTNLCATTSDDSSCNDNPVTSTPYNKLNTLKILATSAGQHESF